jgi:hypothetical protein
MGFALKASRGSLFDIASNSLHEMFGCRWMYNLFRSQNCLVVDSTSTHGLAPFRHNINGTAPTRLQLVTPLLPIELYTQSSFNFNEANLVVKK